VGATEVDSTMTVASDVSLNDGLRVASDVSLNAGLNVAGTTKLVGATEVDSTMTVASDVSLNDGLRVASDVSMNAGLNVAGTTELESILTVAGDVSMNNGLRVASDVSMNAGLNVAGSTTLVGAANFDSTLTVQGDVSLNASLSVGGDTSFNNIYTTGINSSGHIIPSEDATIDLGSSSKRFRSMYVTNTVINSETLYFNDTEDGIIGSLSFNKGKNVIDISANDKNGYSVLTYDDKVSIGRYDNSSPTYNLDVSGDTFVSKETILNGDVSMNANLNVGGITEFNGDVSLNERLYVAGNTTVYGNVISSHHTGINTSSTSMTNYGITTKGDTLYFTVPLFADVLKYFNSNNNGYTYDFNLDNSTTAQDQTFYISTYSNFDYSFADENKTPIVGAITLYRGNKYTFIIDSDTPLSPFNVGSSHNTNALNMAVYSSGSSNNNVAISYNVDIEYPLEVDGTIKTHKHLIVGRDVSMNGRLDVGGDASFNGAVQIKNDLVIE